MELNEYSFKIADEPDTFMSLSNFVPSGRDPVEGCYNIITKYGKLGGDYAKSAIEDEHQLIPFKKPIIMFSAGSFFEVRNNYPEFFGCLLKDIHKNGKIVHYGLAFPLYFKRGKNEGI
ncbi:hypothetical protein DRQ09_07770 [candidate division KSB1 bacterium]|nr:MAG: hypothetical protein DRQ09_07770 [candidate division KSB1 bacterium]